MRNSTTSLPTGKSQMSKITTKHLIAPKTVSHASPQSTCYQTSLIAWQYLPRLITFVFFLRLCHRVCLSLRARRSRTRIRKTPNLPTPPFERARQREEEEIIKEPPQKIPAMMMNPKSEIAKHLSPPLISNLILL